MGATKSIVSRSAGESSRQGSFAPRLFEAIRRSLSVRLKWLGILTAAWTGLYLVLVLPIAAAYEHKIAQRPVVTATATDHRIAVVRRGKTHVNVIKATLTFKRLQDGIWIDCRLDGFILGGAHEPHSMRRTLSVAPEPLSCYEPAEVPLTHLWRGVALFFLAGLAVLATVMLAGGWEWRKLRAQAAA